MTIDRGWLDDLIRFDVNQRERDILWRGAAQELAHQASVLDNVSYRLELGSRAEGACKVIRVLTALMDGLGWDRDTSGPAGTFRLVVPRIEFHAVLGEWLAAIDNTLEHGAEDWIDDALDARVLVARLHAIDQLEAAA
jgi:hypothetical protein